jgi:hypothetical protein
MGTTMTVAADADRDDDAVRFALACYDIGALLSLDRLSAGGAAMAETRPWPAAEEEPWAAGMVWESLRRLATTLELARRTGADPGPAVGARLAALEAVTSLGA